MQKKEDEGDSWNYLLIRIHGLRSGQGPGGIGIWVRSGVPVLVFLSPRLQQCCFQLSLPYFPPSSLPSLVEWTLPPLLLKVWELSPAEELELIPVLRGKNLSYSPMH